MMNKKIEYSTYSYSKDIQKFLNNYHLIKSQFTEKIYRNDTVFLICREFDDQLIITKESFIDKYKNRRYLCKSVETHIYEGIMKDFSYFADKFNFKEIRSEICKSKIYESYFFDGDDFCLEISKDESLQTYLIKLSSDSEDVLDREVAFLEKICEFKKPVIAF